MIPVVLAISDQIVEAYSRIGAQWKVGPAPIRYHLPRHHRSSRCVKRKKQNLHSFIVASFNAQSVKGNDMACKRCEISTSITDNGVDILF